MTEQEVADMVLDILGEDDQWPQIVEVSAGDALNTVELELVDGSRWTLTATPKVEPA